MPAKSPTSTVTPKAAAMATVVLDRTVAAIEAAEVAIVAEAAVDVVVRVAAVADADPDGNYISRY